MPTTLAERVEAVTQARKLVESGLSANKAAATLAAQLGVSARTIKRWAQHTENPLGTLAHDTALKARQIADVEYQARRAELKVKLLDTVDWIIRRVREPHYDYRGKDAQRVEFDVAPDGAVKNYALSAAILLDKIRLEEGKTTGRIESITIDETVRVMRDYIEKGESEAVVFANDDAG